jgi:ABC-2 type transport system permease protein
MKLITVTFYKLKMMLGDRLFFTAMIIIPLLITIAAGYALRYEKNNTIPIAVVDEDHSDYSETLVHRIGQREGLSVAEVSRGTALSLLEGNKIEQVYIIKEGFGQSVRNGETSGIIDLLSSPSSYSAEFTSEVIAGEAIRLITGNMAANWVEEQYGKLGRDFDETLRQEVIKYNEDLWQPKPLMTIEYKELQGKELKAVESVAMPAATATSAGLITAFIMFYVLFSSGWLVEERTNGTLKRLAAGPRALYLSFAGNVLSLLIAGGIQILIFSLVDRLVFKVELFPGPLSYLVFFVYLLSVISVSMFLSSVLKTQAQLQAGAPVFALLTGFAGGCFWNFVEMPERIRQLSLFTPQGWALSGINGLLLDSGNAAAVWPPVLVLFTTALILLPLSYIMIFTRTITR